MLMKIANQNSELIKCIYPLTPLQEGMLYHNIADKDSTGYVIQHIFSFQREDNEERIRQALNLLVMRHDVLRTVIVHDSMAKPSQVVINNRNAEYEVIDLSGLSNEAQDKKINDIANQDIKRGFDLQNNALIRMKYIILDLNRCKMIWSYHHIIMDGKCLSTLFNDFKKYCNQLKNGISIYQMEQIVREEKNETAEFSDYVKWLQNQDRKSGLAYWEELLADYDEMADIKPMVKPESKEEQISQIGIKITEKVSRSLIQLADSLNVTIDAIAEAAWGIVLQNYNGVDDVVYGRVVSGRNAILKGIDNIVGLFINTVPARVKCQNRTVVSELIKELQLQGEKRNDYSYCSLAEIQGLTQQKSELIKTIFLFENYEANEDKYIETARKQTNYAINVCASFDGSTLKFEIIYNANLYRQEEIQILLNRIETVIHTFVADPDEKCLNINLITEDEKAKILGQFNNTDTNYPKNKTVIELFEEQVEKTPENIALIFENRQMTYKSLNQKVNQLAAKIREHGIIPDDFVVILAERSIEMIVGILSILKAGGAYVPIDPTYPKDRVKFMLEDCRPKVILTFQTEFDTEEIPMIKLEEENYKPGEFTNLMRVSKPNHLAYCIYTSGTTGKPKGSLIENKSIVRLVKDTNFIELSEKSVIMQTGSMSFDASTLEVWGALLNGGKLILAPGDVITNSKNLEECLKKYEVNTMWLTSSLYNQMIQSDQEIFDNLRYLLIGGEKLSEEHVRMFKNRKNSVKLINGYGPTENTTFTTTYEIPEQFDMIPIGKPIANTKVVILNKDRLCGIGLPGELCTSGDGLARGYLNRPDLTAKQFIDNPFIKGKLYRTGDLAKWLPDGNIEYLGRVDEQVKIRGFRIELGEIENVIRKLALIKDAAVIVRVNESGDKSICAYMVSDQKLSITNVRELLTELLPEYMIPTYIMQIDKIPITRNGKLNKRALPQVEMKSEREYISPRNQKEKILCLVFSEILGIEMVGVKDSFFELGGDSIKAIRIVSKMRNEGYELSVKEIMNKNTVEAIAHTINVTNENHYEQNEVTGKIPTTPILSEFKAWRLAKPNHFNQDVMIEIHSDNISHIRKVLDALLIHHDIMRAVYKNEMLEILSRQQMKSYDFKVMDYRNKGEISARIEEESTKLQASMDLENGSLMKVALFKTQSANYLVICLHHLIVDGVSWRILLDDFQTALKQVEEGKEIVLPAKTASFKEWAVALEEYKNSRRLNQEKPYWEKVINQMAHGGVPQINESHETGTGEVNLTFDKERTEHLVHYAGKAFHTQVNDLLLSAIGTSLRKLTGQAVVSVGMEGHGREEIHKKMDIDRTVGWFTSMYPIVVECHEDIKDSIIATKEMLRKLPNNGLGYGLLKNELKEIKADIFFNYLGQMDAEFKKSKTIFCSTGKRSGDENKSFANISFTGKITQDILQFDIKYDKSKYSDKTMEQLAKNYKECLIQIIDYCMLQEESIKTASDYSDADLTNKELLILRDQYKDVYEIVDIHSLTPLQNGMLFHYMSDKKTTEYFIQDAFALQGQMDEEKMIQALHLLVQRYDVLRTAIVYEQLDKPKQIVFQHREAEYERIDLSELNKVDQQNILAQITAEDIERGFDLQNEPLIRVKYILLGKDQGKMIWSYHHIIIDGWCLSLLFGSFMRYYNQLKNGKNESEMERIILNERSLTAEYGDYIKWLEKQDQEEGMSYWGELLSDYEETAEIKPMCKPEPTDSQAAQCGIKLSENISQRLADLALSNKMTINTLAEAAWGIVLQKCCGANDVVFGKVVSGRNADIRGIENIVGLFINTVPARVKYDDEMTVFEFLKSYQLQGEESGNHAYCSLADIQGLTRQKGNLIKTLFVSENFNFDVRKLTDSKGEVELVNESTREKTNYPISVCVYYDGNVLNFDIMYNPNEYVKEEIHTILTRIEKVLHIFVEKPEESVARISVITDSEETQILEAFNKTDTDYSGNKTVAALFEEQAAKVPERTAVLFGNQQLTYKELNQKANQLAEKLREFEVKPNDFVAVMTERSLEMMIGILGILKAGGAYVPIDPAYPSDRIEFMLTDCKPKVILTYKAKIDHIQIPIIELSHVQSLEGKSDNNHITGKPEDLAYCIYTSGTTGNPKGSLIENKSIIRLVKNTNYIELNQESIILQTGSMSFDASTFEVWGALLNGGILVLAENDIITSSQKLRQCLKACKINTMWLTSSLFNQMIQSDPDMFDSLKYLLIGGEKLSEKHVRILKNRKTGVKLINGYGPTENTTFTTTYEIPDEFDMIPIGKPISNTKAYIFNNGKLCGIGMPGELYIGGTGLARGYLNRSELTAEKFIDNPFGEGKLYRSGDLSRWLPDGNIEYLGRLDEQVKIRGFRIELGEIENVIKNHKKIKDAAVIVSESASGDKSISAYMVSDETLRLSAMRDYLSEMLPGYMVPAYMMQIDGIPVTRNGKLDKWALPVIETKSERTFIAPRNEKEIALCNAFSEILGIETVGIKDSFFELGGDSIKAIRMVSKMRNAGYKLLVKEIMNRYTVEAIAHTVVDSNENNYEQADVVGLIPSTPIIRSFESWNLERPHHFNQDIMIQVDTDDDEEQIKKALHALAIHHDVLRAVYRNKHLEILSSKESKLYDFKCFDNGISQMEIECTKLQACISLENGPMMKSALFKTENGSYLMICIHHLVVDGISWRILLEDFNTVMEQIRNGKEIELPAKTASFKDWGEALEDYGNSKQLKKEKKYWEKVTNQMEKGKILIQEEGTELGYEDVFIKFSKDMTYKLVHKTGQAFHTEINDLLISAIGRAIKKLTGQVVISIGLEGHGREEIHEKIDIDRTVGWFTTIYPIVLECSEDIEESIITTKEMLRKVPNHGLGYGLLKNEFSEICPEISFNYLGQMDVESKLNKVVFYSAGKSSAEENRIPEKISFNGMITEDRLNFVITYDRSRFSREAVDKLAEYYKTSLEENIEYCLQTEENVRTISDSLADNLNSDDLSLINLIFT